MSRSTASTSTSTPLSRPVVFVRTGVPIPAGAYEASASIRQTLDDAISIGVSKSDSVSSFENTHFLQFITRQSPGEYEFNSSQRVVWDDQESHYMVDGVTPRWRTDSAAHPNPFYEVGGAHIEDDSELRMYDQPAYTFEVNERIIGCTFIIVNNKVCHEVRWSRQYEYIKSEYRSTYHYSIHEVDQLPDWVFHTLNDEYQSNDFGSRSGEKKVYEIPDFLYRPLTKTLSTALIEAKQSVIPAPFYWALKYDEQFGTLAEAKLSESHTHGLFCTTLVSSPEAREWEEAMSQPSNSGTDDKSGPGFGF